MPPREVWIVLIAAAAVGPAAPLEGGSNWVEQFEVGSFEFRSEFSIRETQALVNELARLEDDVETMLGIDAGNRGVQINLFRSRLSYVAYLSQRVPEGVRRQALYVQGPDVGRVYAYRHRNLETDVRHEATHAVLHNALPFIPMWLDEGLAEYFEVSPPLRARRNPHHGRLKWSIRFGWKPDLRRLEALKELHEMDAGDYRESWAWVHFLLHGPPEVRKLFDAYLADIQNGEPPGPLSGQLRRRIPNANALLIQHFK